MRVLYRTRDLIKIGNKDWFSYETRYRLKYGELPEDKIRKIETFEELWESAKDKTAFWNCYSVLTKKRFIKIEGCSKPIYIHENNFTEALFKQEYIPMSYEPTFAQLIQELKVSELIAYCKDRDCAINTSDNN